MITSELAMPLQPFTYWLALATWCLASLSTWTFGHHLGPLQLLVFAFLALAACVVIVWPLIAASKLLRSLRPTPATPAAVAAEHRDAHVAPASARAFPLFLRFAEICIRFPVALVAIVVLTYLGDDLGIELEFAACSSGWERTAERVRAGEISPPVAWTVERSADAHAGEHAPHRSRPHAAAQPPSPAPLAPIAISRGGFLDNWCGFVHDPTGELAKAVERGDGLLSRDRSADVPVRVWFGGVMIEARRVSRDPRWKDWYVCWFT